MTDRELLQNAAKAAGITIEFREVYSSDFRSKREMALIREDGHWKRRVTDCKFWEPLTDDGDAFRLMTKLKLLILPNKEGDATIVDSYTECEGVEALHNANDDSAIRRAIVLAAAAIGAAQGGAHEKDV